MASKHHTGPVHGLKRIHVRSFKGIKSLEMDDFPKTASWIFLTGENGYGKTSVLQAIAAGLAGSPEHLLSQIPKNGRSPKPWAQIATHDDTFLFDLTDREFKVRSISSDYPGAGKLFPHVACYGSARLDTYTEASIDADSGDKTRNLFDSRSLLRNIELQLSRWYFKRRDPEFKKKYEGVTGLLKTLLGVKHIKVDEKTDQVLYTEQDVQGEVYSPLPSLQLASGYRSIISMIGDMILRLFETQPKIANPVDLVGIVIIDELDLHFHPKWQKRLPGLLSDLFPRIQFIASTHSPIPLLGAPKGSVFLRVNRSPEDGIMLERLDEMEEMIGNMLPTAILTSPIFGMQDIFPASHDKQNRIRTEDTYDEILVNDFMEKRLANYEGTEMEKELEAFIKEKKESS